MSGENLTGNYFVRGIRPAFSDAEGLFRRTRSKVEIRRHALKLRYWPSPSTVDEHGQVVDLDWSKIQSLPGSDIAELRIDDIIDGLDNLRIIFFVGPPSDKFPKTCIWILAVMQKKRDYFTQNDIRIFRLRRLLVLRRFYEE
jgi:hypothetical protein